MGISDEELFKSANSYRLHQDVLRWTLLAGYAAFFVGILSIEEAKLVDPARIVLVAIGVCYMFILAVENFFYNLFAEYVKDCEGRQDTGKQLRTMREFSRTEVRRIGPFHHSFFFALLIVGFGNMALAQPVASCTARTVLYAVNWLSFILILLLWRALVYPFIVLPLQRIFDVSDEQRNWIWRFFGRFRKRGKGKD
jgi:hypothetical protein